MYDNFMCIIIIVISIFKILTLHHDWINRVSYFVVKLTIIKLTIS